MIREQAPDILPDDYYSGKISTYYKAYGDGYDFCRFYSCGKAVAMLFNSTLTVYGIPDDAEEFESFVHLISPYTIESELTALTGFMPCETTQFEGRVEFLAEAEMILSVYEMSGLVARLLGADRDMWYTDMSHRIRHGVSSAYRCGGSYAAADIRYGDKVFISSVVSPENERHRGNIRTIFGEISRNAVCAVRAEPELYSFYGHMGLCAVKKQYLLINKDKR